MLLNNRLALHTGALAGGFRLQGTSSQSLITIASGKVSANQTGFQVKVDLADLPTQFWSHVTADGGNIRAYTTGGTELPIDVPYINTTLHTGWVFVRVDVPTGGTSFYLRTEYNKTMYAATDPHGMVAVWSEMAAVFSGNSLKNRASASGALFDCASGYTVDLTTRPGWFTGTASGTSGAPMKTATFGNNNVTWTMSATANYAKPAGGTTNDMVVGSYAWGDWAASGSNSFFAAYGRTGNGVATADLYFDYMVLGGYSGGVQVNSDFTPSVDNRVVMIVDNMSNAIYKNGVYRNGGTMTKYAFTTATGSPFFFVGTPYGNYAAARFIGSITDAYMRTGTITTARMAAEHANWNWGASGKGFYAVA